MNIKSIELTHAQPSLGPHERRTSYSIQAKDFPRQIQELLAKTKVNGAVDLGAYLELLQKNVSTGVQRVCDRYKPEHLTEGGVLNCLSFYLVPPYDRA